MLRFGGLTAVFGLVLGATASWSPASGQGVQYTTCDVSVGGAPNALATDDFNSDGNPDLAVVDQGRNQVIILLTDPLAFQALNCANAATRADVGVGTNPVAIAAGDLEQNQTVDLAVATQGGISILRSNTSGVFQAQAPIPGGADPQAVAIADVNGDARNDIVVGNGSGNSVTILFGAAQNEFAIAQAVVLPVEAPVSLVIAEDLDLDGEIDIAAGSTLSGEVRVFLHDSSSPTMFRALDDFSVGTAPTAMVAADLTGDAFPDLAVVGGGVAGELSIYRNALPGSERPAFVISDEKFEIGARPSSVAAGNINSDFDVDLVVTNQDDDTVPFFFGNGNGTVTLGPGNCSLGGSLCTTEAAPRAVALADIDADGRRDVITANQGRGSVAGSLTYLLSSHPHTPTVTPTRTATETPPVASTPSATPSDTVTPTPTISPVPTPTISNCFVPQTAPFCDIAECWACVCDAENGDPFCCAQDGNMDGIWDLTCVQSAEGRCAASCPRAATPTITTTPTITRTPSVTPTATATESETPTITGTRPRTATPTFTPTGPSPTLSPSPTITLTPTNIPTETPTQTQRPTSTPRCVGEGPTEICTSGGSCAIVPNSQRSAGALLILFPALFGLAFRRLH